MPAIFQCPSNPNRGCCYVAIAGVFVPGKEEGGLGSRIDPATAKSMSAITAGVTNTIAIIEVREPFNWMDPTADIDLAELLRGINAGGRVGSFHSGGCNVGMLDGSVRFLPDSTDTTTLRSMGTGKF